MSEYTSFPMRNWLPPYLANLVNTTTFRVNPQIFKHLPLLINFIKAPSVKLDSQIFKKLVCTSLGVMSVLFIITMKVQIHEWIKSASKEEPANNTNGRPEIEEQGTTGISGEIINEGRGVTEIMPGGENEGGGVDEWETGREYIDLLGKKIQEKFNEIESQQHQSKAELGEGGGVTGMTEEIINEGGGEKPPESPVDNIMQGRSLDSLHVRLDNEEQDKSLNDREGKKEITEEIINEGRGSEKRGWEKIEQLIKERDERGEETREEIRQIIKEIEEREQEAREEIRQLVKKTEEEMEQLMQETDERRKETDERRKETDERIKQEWEIIKQQWEIIKQQDEIISTRRKETSAERDRMRARKMENRER